jgi:hypothetical protein
MAVSKKIRFEVFKRDGFKCQYCGKTPPEIMLEVDHIQPKSKKGKDDFNNLITSCFDCNRGKSNHELKQVPNSIKTNTEIILERELQYKEYQKILSKINKRIQREIDEVDQCYNSFFNKYLLSDNFKQTTVKNFINKLGLIDTLESMKTACIKINNSTDSIKYFCGICWNKIKNDEL